MRTGYLKSFKTNLALKYFVIKKLIKSEKFVFLDFKKLDKENGYAEGYFSKGFIDGHVTGLMDLAQLIHTENMKHDNMDSVIDEVKQLINNE